VWEFWVGRYPIRFQCGLSNAWMVVFQLVRSSTYFYDKAIVACMSYLSSVGVCMVLATLGAILGSVACS